MLKSGLNFAVKADTTLVGCNGRYHNPPHVELQIAAAEQQKITEQRLLKHVASSSSESSQTAESSMTQDAVARRAGQLHRHLGGCQSREQFLHVRVWSHARLQGCFGILRHRLMMLGVQGSWIMACKWFMADALRHWMPYCSLPTGSIAAPAGLART